MSYRGVNTRQGLVLLASMLAAGCIHTSETEIRDETRLAVEFENETAGRIFYEELSRRPNRTKGEESSTKVSVPVVFSTEKRVVRGPNAGFNQAVRECDTNRDARITESEARIWAGQRR